MFTKSDFMTQSLSISFDDLRKLAKYDGPPPVLEDVPIRLLPCSEIVGCRQNLEMEHVNTERR